MSDQQISRARPPFKPLTPQQNVERFRAAIARVWSTRDADEAAPLEVEQTFDGDDGIRMVITVEPGEDNSLTLHVAAEAYPGERAALTERDMPLVVWSFQRFTHWRSALISGYLSDSRIHLVYAAPPEAGTPAPVPEPMIPPPPPPVPGDLVAEATVDDGTEIPPGLRPPPGSPPEKARGPVRVTVEFENGKPKVTAVEDVI